MARPRKNHINPDEILIAVFRQTVQVEREIDAELATIASAEPFECGRFQTLHRLRRQAEFAEYSIRVLIGQHLTDAEKKAYQRKILAMEKMGFVEILGVRGSKIRLTPAGVELAENALRQEASCS